MNKFLFIILFPTIVFSQQDLDRNKGELKTNLFDLVVGKTVNIGYEHYLKGNQSVQLDLNLFDTYSYLDASYMEKNDLHSLQASYNIYFSNKKNHHGFMFYPFLKIRTGHQEIEGYDYSYYDDVAMQYIYVNRTEKYDLSGFEAGFGLGHKWVFNNRISLFAGSQIGRDFSGNRISDYYSDIDFKAFITLGFKF